MNSFSSSSPPPPSAGAAASVDAAASAAAAAGAPVDSSILLGAAGAPAGSSTIRGSSTLRFGSGASVGSLASDKTVETASFVDYSPRDDASVGSRSTLASVASEADDGLDLDVPEPPLELYETHCRAEVADRVCGRPANRCKSKGHEGARKAPPGVYRDLGKRRKDSKFHDGEASCFATFEDYKMVQEMKRQQRSLASARATQSSQYREAVGRSPFAGAPAEVQVEDASDLDEDDDEVPESLRELDVETAKILSQSLQTPLIKNSGNKPRVHYRGGSSNLENQQPPVTKFSTDPAIIAQLASSEAYQKRSMAVQNTILDQLERMSKRQDRADSRAEKHAGLLLDLHKAQQLWPFFAQASAPDGGASPPAEDRTPPSADRAGRVGVSPGGSGHPFG